MECPNCKWENLAGANFCVKCGNSLANTNQNAQFSGSQLPVKRVPKWLLATGLLIVVIVIVIVTVSFLGNPIVGTWMGEGGDDTITFTRNGKWYTSYGDSGTYDIDGSVIMVTEDGWPSEVLDFSIDGKTLRIDNDYFTKVD